MKWFFVVLLRLIHAFLCLRLVRSSNQTAFSRSTFRNLISFDPQAAKNDECPAVSRGEIPHLWVQAGEPRSGSTLAFIILLFIGEKVCGGKGMVFTYDGSISVNHAWDIMKKTTHPNSLRVVKTHNFHRGELSHIGKNEWVFFSGYSDKFEKNTTKEIGIYYHHSVQYVQKMSHTLNLDARIMWEYEPFFKNLTHVDFTHMFTALQYWDILRLCCGPQMSIHWRNYLEGVNMINETSHPNVQTCLNHNLTEVEESLSQVIRLRNVGNFLQQNVSNIGYCSCTIDQVRKQHLSFSAKTAKWKEACGSEFVMLEGIAKVAS